VKLTDRRKGEGSISACPTCGTSGYENDECWKLYPKLKLARFNSKLIRLTSNRLREITSDNREIKSF